MKQIKLYYDKECPFCKKYSDYIELRKRYDIKIINARDAIKEIKTFKEKGFDINKGMIIQLDSKIYQGANAAKVLDNCIYKNSLIDKTISFFIKVPGFKNIIYPLVLIFRKIILRVFGKNPNIKY